MAGYLFRCTLFGREGEEDEDVVRGLWVGMETELLLGFFSIAQIKK
jgi:hypothetical protein